MPSPSSRKHSRYPPRTDSSFTAGKTRMFYNDTANSTFSHLLLVHLFSINILVWTGDNGAVIYHIIKGSSNNGKFQICTGNYTFFASFVSTEQSSFLSKIRLSTRMEKNCYVHIRTSTLTN